MAERRRMEPSWMIVLIVLIIVGPLVNLLMSKTYGLYRGSLGEGFLKHLEPGKDYSVSEVIKLIDDKTDGDIRLSRKAAEGWLESFTKVGRLKKKTSRRGLGRGFYKTIVYSLV